MRAGPAHPVGDADHAADTPFTVAYAQEAAALITKTWAHSIEKRTDLAHGTVVIHLMIDRQGTVVNPRLVTGTPEDPLARSALHAVLTTQLPTMPDFTVKELGGKRVSLYVTFDYRLAPEPGSTPAPR